MKALLKFRRIIFLFFFAMLMQYGFAQYNNLTIDTTAEKFYPLRVGNSWTYNTFYNSIQTGRYKLTIRDSVFFNGHFYYNLYSRSQNGDTAYLGAKRVDSVYGRILISTASGCSWLQNEVIVDSLRAQVADSFNVSCTIRGICESLGSINLFGSQVQNIIHKYQSGMMLYYNQYARGFGLYYSSSSYSGTASSRLAGCVINGQIFGDTVLMGLTNISGEIPDFFSLEQNFLNPFNPTTKIRFVISPAGAQNIEPVQLVIYDILGREVAALVNEQLKPGTYEVEWDASNYPSGVYFYKLFSGEFSETRKMLLVK